MQPQNKERLISEITIILSILPVKFFISDMFNLNYSRQYKPT